MPAMDHANDAVGYDINGRVALPTEDALFLASHYAYQST